MLHQVLGRFAFKTPSLLVRWPACAPSTPRPFVRDGLIERLVRDAHVVVLTVTLKQFLHVREIPWSVGYKELLQGPVRTLVLTLGSWTAG